MPKVLTENSDINCANQGSISPSGESKLVVSGGKVLVQGSVAGQSISGCATVANTNTGAKPCTTVSSVLNPPARKLTIGGTAALLSTLIGIADGTDAPPVLHFVSATANQSKLTSL